MRLSLVFFTTMFLVLIGCSSKKPGVIDCEKNTECPAGQKCDLEKGRCVDIYFPNLGQPKGV